MSELNDNMAFDMNAFLEGLAKDSQKEFQVSDRAKKVLMNLRDNQGNITLVPIISRKIGNIYCRLGKVREFKAMTSVIESEDPVWYKVLPKELYGELTTAESELYDEVTGLFDTVEGYGAFEFDELRTRKYSLFTGVCLNHVNLDGNKVEDNINQPVLLIFPSHAPIDALNTAIAQKKSLMGDRTIDWLTRIITPNNTNRQGVIQINFKKPDSPGYTSTVNFEVNNPSDFIEVVDPKRDFTEEAKKFEDPISSFIGWMNDQENNKRFNETVFRELRDNLKLALKELTAAPKEGEEEKPENKNGGDPMLNPPIPGVNPEPAEPVKPSRPF